MKVLTHALSSPLEIRDGTDAGDGRTLVGLAVPYDTELDVSDVPWEPAYTEVFRFGAFERTLNNRSRPVGLLISHNRQGLPIGEASLLRETEAGLEAAFRLYHSGQADEVLGLVHSGWRAGLSIGFEPMPGGHRVTRGHDRDPATDRDLVERTEVRLHEVSVCNLPAYDLAGVTGVREATASHPSLASLAAERQRLALARSTAVDRWGRLVRR